jgi:hypothetical protein
MAKTLTLRDANQQIARCIREVEGAKSSSSPATALPLLILSAPVVASLPKVSSLHWSEFATSCELTDWGGSSTTRSMSDERFTLSDER